MINVRMSPEQHTLFQTQLEVQKSWLIYREKKREMKLARKNWEKWSGLDKAYSSPPTDQDE